MHRGLHPDASTWNKTGLESFIETDALGKIRPSARIKVYWYEWNDQS